MRIGLSIFLIALGAILRFAVETSIEGINLAMTGAILMVIGVIGLLVSLAFWSSLSPARRRATTTGHEVVRDIETTTTRDPGIV